MDTISTAPQMGDSLRWFQKRTGAYIACQRVASLCKKEPMSWGCTTRLPWRDADTAHALCPAPGIWRGWPGKDADRGTLCLAQGLRRVTGKMHYGAMRHVRHLGDGEADPGQVAALQAIARHRDLAASLCVCHHLQQPRLRIDCTGYIQKRTTYLGKDTRTYSGNRNACLNAHASSRFLQKTTCWLHRDQRRADAAQRTSLQCNADGKRVPRQHGNSFLADLQREAEARGANRAAKVVPLTIQPVSTEQPSVCHCERSPGVSTLCSLSCSL